MVDFAGGLNNVVTSSGNLGTTPTLPSETVSAIEQVNYKDIFATVHYLPFLGNVRAGFFALRPLECLDKTKCAVICYYDLLPEDEYTARFRAASDVWHVIRGWSHEHLAQQVRRDEIDLLFDLMGHTGTRLLAFARKPAPLQITWLGYVGTTGLMAMDCLLADRFHVRPDEERFYCEQVIRMPHDYVCYGPPPISPDVGPLPAASAGHVTFGCFNNAVKLSPPILDAWAQSLLRVPRP